MQKKILFLVFTLTTLICFGQRNVTGQVKSPDGQTVVGVTVQIKGTQIGVVTDLDGKYSLQVPNDSDSLVFSFLGTQTVETSVDGKMVVNVELQPLVQQMEQFVVTGYAVQKRSDVSGSVSMVAAKDIMRVPTPSVEQALQGQAAGVSVTAATGAPGAPIAVRIRGVGSISSSNDPLYIIDGIPAENMRNISPNDIENITVLKDASSAAIYGSRANNGVVLITTKQGISGKAKVEYNMQIGLQHHGKLVDLINTKQFIELYNEATLADNAISPVKRPLIEAGGYMRDFEDVDWLEAIFRPALLHTHEFSVSGGTDKLNYLVSASYFSQDGIIINTNFNRFSLRSNIKADVKKWLTVGLNVQASSSFERRVASSGDGLASKASGGISEGGSVIRYAMFMNSARPIFNPDGSYADSPSEVFGDPMYNTFFDNSYNPVGLANMTDMTDRLNSFVGSGNILVKLPHNLSIKGVVGVDYGTMTTRRFNNVWGTNNRIGAINSMSVGIDNSLAVTANATLNHNFTVADKHNFNYFVGSEIITQNWKSLGGSDGELGDIHYLGFGTKDDNVSQGESDARLLSFFASFNYNFDRKYYISGLIREDGSSRFAKGNRWGTFYSVSASWNMEREKFMKDVTAISKFKWRVGWGSIGNQNVGLYAALGRYGRGRYYPFGAAIEEGYYMTSLGNTELKWETSNQLNAGVDMEFLDGSLGLSLDYFYKITDNMLVEASYPPSAGLVGFPWINNGSVLNTGVDVELFYRKYYKKGGFEIKLNGGYLHNEVLSLLAPIESGMVDNGIYATRCVVGRPVGSFFLYEFEGIFQDNVEILTHATQGPSGTIKPGDAKYKDQNNDNVIDEKDRVYQGSAIPKFSAGLTLSGEYAGFDLNMFFQGAFGQKIYVQFFHDTEGFYRGFPTTMRYYEEHWTPENQSNTMPRAAWSASQNHRAGTTRFLQDGSYVRLKNIQLGYTIPGLKKAGIEKLRIYIAASNLFTITKYTGLDPEMTVSLNSAAEGDRANGIDWGTYPNAITYSFGLNLTF